ncbi:hypothetical protein C8Q79DRAFT_412872 [Trametes meyenii]|nr:hypothetical protein C8Q79DRAFT_412872 [Trametes meyenii]
MGKRVCGAVSASGACSSRKIRHMLPLVSYETRTTSGVRLERCGRRRGHRRASQGGFIRSARMHYSFAVVRLRCTGPRYNIDIGVHLSLPCSHHEKLDIPLHDRSRSANALGAPMVASGLHTRRRAWIPSHRYLRCGVASPRRTPRHQAISYPKHMAKTTIANPVAREEPHPLIAIRPQGGVAIRGSRSGAGPHPRRRCAFQAQLRCGVRLCLARRRGRCDVRAPFQGVDMCLDARTVTLVALSPVSVQTTGRRTSRYFLGILLTNYQGSMEE